MDRLAQIWEMQEALNNFTFKNMDIANPYTFKTLRISDFREATETPGFNAKGGLADTWIMNYARAALIECLELKEEYHLASEKIDGAAAQDAEGFEKIVTDAVMAYRIEVVDILHFIISQLQCLGLDYRSFREVLATYSGTHPDDGMLALFNVDLDTVPEFFHDDIFSDLTKYVSEAMTSLPWKHWSKKSQFEPAEVQAAIMWSFVYWVRVCRSLQMTPDDVYNIYIKKNEVNFNRQKSGTYSEATKVDDVGHIRAGG